MFGKKTLFAAAAVAVLSAAGLGSASAAPWDHRHAPAPHGRYVDRVVIERGLRPYHYRMIGAPTFVRGHYVVRTRDRFGRAVTVRVNPYTGAYMGVYRF